MIVVPSPVSAFDSGIVARKFFMRLWNCGRLLAGCALAAASMAGSGAKAIGQTAHFTGAETMVGSGFYEPFGVAVDKSGNLFVADADTFTIYEIVAVNGTIPKAPTIRVLARTSGNPEHVTVDSRGNVYYTDLDTNSNFQNNTVKEILAVNGSIPASPTIRQLGGGLFYPGGVAVDASGNVYVADKANGVVKEMLAVNGIVPDSPAIITLTGDFYAPDSVAVDPSGNVYVTATDRTTSAKEVFEFVAVNGNIPSSPMILTLATGFCSPDGVALDRGGNLFFSDYCKSAVYEIVAVNGVIPANPTINQVRGGFPGIEGLAVDTNTGNIYVGGVYNSIPEIIVSGTNFGMVNVGSSSQSIPLSFTFDSAGTLGSTSVLMQGIPGLDFTDAGTGTCKANTPYPYGASCTVDVAFTPRSSGMRYGAAVLKDTSGNVIATGYVQGTAVGPQLIFWFGPRSTIANAGPFYTGQVAVDGSGNVYIADSANSQVLKETPSAGTYAQSSIGSGFNKPAGVAVDGAGIVYIADSYNNRLVIETPSPGGYVQSVVGTGLSLPMRVAVDGNGSIYVSDYGNERVVKETPSSGVYTQGVVASTGLNGPSGVAVDGTGNVYITDVFNNRVLKETPSAGGYAESTVTTSSLINPNGVAVDANGSIYIADTGHDRIVKELPSMGSYFESSIVEGLNLPGDVALDAAGNMYISNNSSVLKQDFADPPSLAFASTPVGSISIDSPRNVAIGNIGNTALVFPILSTGNNPSIAANFTLNTTGTDAVCPLVSSSSSQPAVLQPGGSCKFPVSFAPVAVGAISGSLVLTDNNLNGAAPGYATQTIDLSGTATQSTPVIYWHTPAPITYGTPLSTAQLNATANVPGTFSYSPAAGTVLPVGSDALTVTFTPTDTTAYTTATASVTLNVQVATPVITWNTPAPITYGTALGAAQLNASSPASGTFVYTPAAGTVLSAGQQTLTVKFTPADSVDYTEAAGSVVLTVNKATPIITWPAPAPIPYGTPLSGTQLNATANVPGTFAYNPAAGTALPVGTNTLTATFTPTDSQDYATATASVFLTVTPNFALSPSVGSIAIVQNSSANITISVLTYGGFADAVQLSVSGLPNGVTASFSPNPTTTTSALTFKVSPKATVGTSYLTITGSSGGLIHTTTVALTIVSRK